MEPCPWNRTHGATPARAYPRTHAYGPTYAGSGLAVGLAAGSGCWLWPLALPAGSPRWLSPLALPAGSPRWLSPLALPAGSPRWLCPRALAVGSGRWLWPLALAVGSGRCLWPLSLAAGSGRWLCRACGQPARASDPPKSSLKQLAPITPRMCPECGLP